MKITHCNTRDQVLWIDNGYKHFLFELISLATNGLLNNRAVTVDELVLDSNEASELVVFAPNTGDVINSVIKNNYVKDTACIFYITGFNVPRDITIRNFTSTGNRGTLDANSLKTCLL